MDAGTGDVRAVEFTSSRQGDSPLLPELLAQVPLEEMIGMVTADGAYDTRRCHDAIIDRGADAVIPIRRNGRAWKKTASLPPRETRSCGQPDAWAGRSGRRGPATTSEVGSRPR